MKVDVITIHAVSNYGSLLQAIATQRVIENLGHSCEIIDYIPKAEQYTQIEKTLLKNKPGWNNHFIKRFIYLALRQPEAIMAGKAFEKWRERYLNLTRRYSDFEELKNQKPKADLYLTGSDQVWGPTGEGIYDKSYCLAFADGTDKKTSYAASFGHTELNAELSEHFKKWLKAYSNITVRESSAVEILQKIGIPATQVLDPTLLLNAEQWCKAEPKKKNKKYILVYQIHNNPKLDEYAKKVSKATGMPLIRVSSCLHQLTRGGKFKWLPDLNSFLAYIRDAECMITDSFHGTAFAINFGVRFVEILAENGTQGRNQSILELTGLCNRILKDENDIELAMRPIDYSSVNSIIEEKRKESLEILKSILESENL